MKRFFCAVAVLFFLSVIPEQQACAQTTTPIPTSPAVRQIETGGALNELLDNSVPFSIGGTAPSVTITIKDVNLTTGADFNVPKLETIANFFASGVRFLTPYVIKEKTIDQEKNLYISGRARYCKTNENNRIVEQESKQAYTTEIIPELSTLDQASRFAAAITSRYSISPVDGDYNYNTDREPLELARAPLCDETDTGDTQETKTVKTTGGFFNTGGLLELFKSIFGTGGVVKATLASRQLTPYAESMDCLITGCAAGGDLSYLKNEEEQKRVKEAGGVVETYAHISHTITGDETSGEQDNAFSNNQTIKTHTLGTKAVEDATNYMKCAILPKALRDKYGLSDKCKQDVPTATPESQSCDATFEGVTLDPSKYSGFGSSNDSVLGFSIPMHTTSCTIQNVEAVADFAAQWIKGRPEEQQAKENVLAYYKTIEEWAVKMGWNPSYLVALWIEETAAGAIGAQPMGCTFDVEKGVGVGRNSTVCEQLLCIYHYPVRNSTYDLLCSYAAGGVGCTTFALDQGKNDNRCFPSNIRGTYQEVVARGNVSASGCSPVGRTSQLFVDDCKAKDPNGSPFD